jgi:hypothetical protein
LHLGSRGGILRPTGDGKEAAMTLRSLAACAALLTAVAGTLGGCAPTGFGGAQPARGTAELCEPLFREFDRLKRLFPAGPPLESDAVSPPALERQGDRLMRGDCITRSRHLEAIERAPRSPVGERGAPIDPISIHAGAVPGLIAELDARAYFRQRGIRLRSVGEATLGRRIYLGPFRTEGGLAGAAQAARDAGFVAPYPARF